jgi:hypothetical protein
MAKEGMMINDGLLAAFLDGNVSGKEVEAILKAAAHDSSLKEFLALAALAAEAQDGLCAVHCERYILQCFGISRPVDELVSFMLDRDLIKDGGTPLANVGCISKHYGLSVNRIFASGMEDVEAALAAGRQVIAAVDVGELDPSKAEYESLEDRIIGPRPDHCVVVLSCDHDYDEVVCYDPSEGDIPVSIPVTAFLDAWKDSENYMVTVGRS